MPGSPLPSLPTDVEAIFKEVVELLQSDNEQNSTLPEPFRSQIAGGINCDELPGASGEFGRSPLNPIPTNGPLGEVTYLSRLRTNARSPVMFHRVRAEEGGAGTVDVYEVLSLDGKVRETLFLSLYHPRKSRKVPRGYTYAAKFDPSNFTYGVNHIVANFPQKLDAHIRKWQMEGLGIPLPVARVRETINGSRLKPSVLNDLESADHGSEEGQLRDDLLKLMRSTQDPRFKGQGLAIGTDGIERFFAGPKPTKRSKWFRSVAKGYFGIGAILATMMWLSYLWPLTWGSSRYLPEATFWERTVAIAIFEPVFVFYAGVRLVFWGPGLVGWYYFPNDYSFGKWLAPGLYMDKVELAK